MRAAGMQAGAAEMQAAETQAAARRAAARQTEAAGKRSAAARPPAPGWAPLPPPGRQPGRGMRRSRWARSPR